MKILFFSSARAAVGRDEDVLSVDEPIKEAILWDTLIDRYPALENIREVTRLAKNGAYVGDDVLFVDSDEVALIPPVSGG